MNGLLNLSSNHLFAHNVKLKKIEKRKKKEKESGPAPLPGPTRQAQPPPSLSPPPPPPLGPPRRGPTRSTPRQPPFPLVGPRCASLASLRAACSASARPRPSMPAAPRQPNQRRGPSRAPQLPPRSPAAARLVAQPWRPARTRPAHTTARGAVPRLPPPLPLGAHAPGRKCRCSSSQNRPLRRFSSPDARIFRPSAQFSRPRPRRDLAVLPTIDAVAQRLPAPSSSVVNLRSPRNRRRQPPTSLHPALIAIVEVRSPRPLSPSPSSLSPTTDHPRSPSSRRSASPAKPRSAAAQLRGQQALRAAVSLPS
jgi:hypothetical protein